MKTMRKRIAGAAVAAVMAVTSTMTGLSGLTAGAANAVTSWGGGVQSDDVTLLVGEKSALRGATVAETLANANKTYVLGIASQFCIFLEDDFKSHDSDAEGRIAVGGGANLSPYIGWDYEVGKGDYNTGESLESLLGDSGYAHLIINNGPVRQLNTDNRQIFWIGDGVDMNDTATNYRKYGLYQDAKDQFFQSSDFSVADQFALLQKNSQKLSRQKATGTFSVSGDTATFTYTGSASTAEEVVFTLTPEEWAQYQECIYVKYENIPALKTPRTVVANDGSPTTWNNSYIVVNVAGSGDLHISDINHENGQKFTYINDVAVGRTGPSDDDQKDNNHPGVTSLLYNFYEASRVVLANNFQGTILAPLADVTDEWTLEGRSDSNHRGHLSGALIAKSFDGGTEFGYRPYTGPYSLLSVDTGYTVDLRKVDAKGNLLSGAALVLYQKQADGQWDAVDAMVTEDLQASYNAQFDIGEEDPDAPATLKHEYYIAEEDAPDGYQKSEMRYYIDYEETYEEQDGLIVSTEVRVTMYPATTDHQKPQTGGVTYVVNTAYTIASGEIQEKQFTCDGTTYTLTRDGDSWKYGGDVLSTENRFDDTTIPGMRIDTENMLIYPPFKAPSQQPAVGPASHDTEPAGTDHSEEGQRRHSAGGRNPFAERGSGRHGNGSWRI